jgi:methylmalonyl-CoA mutase
MRIHVRTSKRTKTIYDPYVNLLRATTEAFSAIVGGADTLHVSTYDEAYGSSHEHAERWARNIQHIFYEEAHIGKVVDPARGSYYAEALTKELAEQAWHVFQQIEERGGMSAMLQQGWIQEQIASIAGMRKQYVTTMKQKIVGTNVYINKEEKRVQIDDVKQRELRKQRSGEVRTYKEQRSKGMTHVSSPSQLDELLSVFGAGATIGEVTAAWKKGGESVQVLQPMRDAEPFEVLRETARK